MPSASGSNVHFSREKLLQVARSLPADLQVLSQLGEMLQDINSDLDEIAALLRRDLALATRIVRIANSPVYGGGSRIASTEEAVNRVGFSEILKLVGTATAARFSEQTLEYYRIDGHTLRDNMLYVALAAEALARMAGLDPRVAYTAGLLRPLGVMVLDRACRGQVNPAQAYDAGRWPNYSAWEGSLFGVDNREVTALCLDEWRFPSEVAQGVRAHYWSRPSDREASLAALLNVANHLAQRVSRSLAGEAEWWSLSPDKLRVAGLTEDDLEPAMATTAGAFDAALMALSA